MRNLNHMWDALRTIGVCEQTLQTVTNINGYREDVLNDILYATTGYRNLDQLPDGYMIGDE